MTENKPLAVITVTYSPGPYLERFLESVYAGYSGPTYTLLADNGSADGIPEEAARERQNVEFLATGGNLGYGAAINAGVRRLNELRRSVGIDSEFFVIVNPDVEFTAGSIDEMIACARRHPQAAAIGPRIQEPSGSTYPSARSIPTLGNGIGHALLGKVWPSNPWTKSYLADADMDNEREAGWLSGSCLLLRWEAFEKVGGFDERYFMYMEDVDLGDRFGRAGYENVYCPNAVITHAQGHSTNRVSELMLPAHHASAYRFQADRHPGFVAAPLRLVLVTGLKFREFLAVSSARRRRRTVH